VETLSLWDGDQVVPSQVLHDPKTGIALAFVTPVVPGFGLKATPAEQGPSPNPSARRVTATAEMLESPSYKLAIDRKTGGLSSLLHKPTGREVVVSGKRGSLARRSTSTGTSTRSSRLRPASSPTGPHRSRETRARWGRST